MNSTTLAIDRLTRIGAEVRARREACGMTVPELSRITRISEAQIRSLEAGAFTELPGPVFVRGFLRSIAKTLGDDPVCFLDLYALTAGAAGGQDRHAAGAAHLESRTSVAPSPDEGNVRYGVALAFVAVVLLFSLAISVVLRPRGHDMPPELSRGTSSPSFLA